MLVFVHLQFGAVAVVVCVFVGEPAYCLFYLKNYTFCHFVPFCQLQSHPRLSQSQVVLAGYADKMDVTPSAFHAFGLQ